MGCREDSRGYVSEGWSRRGVGALLPGPCRTERGGGPWVSGGRPRSPRLALMGVKGWVSAARAGAGVAGPWELKALAPSGQCETALAGSLRAGRHLSADTVTVYSARAKTTQRRSRAERLPFFPPSLPRCPTEAPAKAGLSSGFLPGLTAGVCPGQGVPLDPSAGSHMASTWSPGRLLPATPGLTPLRTRGHTWTSHPETAPSPGGSPYAPPAVGRWQEPQDPGREAATQKGSDWRKEAHTRLPWPVQSSPAEGHWPGSLSGWHGTGLPRPVPGHGGPRPPPAASWRAGGESEPTHTDRPRSLGRQDGLSGRLMHLYSDQGKREREGRRGRLVSDASVILAVHRAARTLTRSRALEPRSE